MNGNVFIRESVYIGVLISLLSYFFGAFLKKKTGIALFNPLLVAIICTMAFLLGFHIEYEDYKKGADVLSWFLTPATVCLAIPLYDRFSLLRKNLKAVLIGMLSGVLSSFFSILAFCLLFRLGHLYFITLLPKSITTAIGMGVSEELGGIVNITVAVIVITGVIGNVIADSVFRIFKITEPIAKGIALGSSAHAIGTAKALEIGEIEGAMSSLSIAVSGILTVFLAPVMAQLF